MNLIELLNTIFTKSMLLLIKFYQLFLSPYLPPSCIYNPTCSEYAKEAIRKYGCVKGSFLSLKRLLRCHPFAKGGDDFVR